MFCSGTLFRIHRVVNIVRLDTKNALGVGADNIIHSTKFIQFIYRLSVSRVSTDRLPSGNLNGNKLRFSCFKRVTIFNEWYAIILKIFILKI